MVAANMVTTTLLESAIFSFVSAGTFIFVGHRLGRRSLPAEAQLAGKAFVAFWYGLALSSVVGATGLPALIAAFETPGLPFILLMNQIGLVAISVALWGLLYYLVYLYTGRRGSWVPIAAFYALFFLFLEYFLLDLGAIGVKVERWQVMPAYEKNLEGPAALQNPYVIALIIGLLVPQILASLAYMSLSFRVRDPTQQYRILLVSISILVWFGSPFLALGINETQQDWYQIVSRFIGLGAAVTIFLAYHPPGWIRRRYNIAGLSEDRKEEPVEAIVEGTQRTSRPLGALG